MSEYVITTDNNSDLPEEYLKDHGVGCMYLRDVYKRQPQATLMKMIVEGIMGGKLPWTLVFIGVFLAIRCV